MTAQEREIRGAIAWLFPSIRLAEHMPVVITDDPVERRRFVKIDWPGAPSPIAISDEALGMYRKKIKAGFGAEVCPGIASE